VSGFVSGGVFVTGSPRFVLADSVVDSVRGPGVAVHADDARLVRNHFNAVDADHDDFALRLTGSRARVADNRVTGGWLGGFFLLGSDNVVAYNQLTGLLGDGILVGDFSSAIRLRHNAVDGMADDGIEVQAAGTRLEGNSATTNGDWGIDAVPGAIDLGGNTASGNGQAAQCRNVACD
jgi:Right handed beta helix region